MKKSMGLSAHYNDRFRTVHLLSEMVKPVILLAEGSGARILLQNLGPTINRKKIKYKINNHSFLQI
jgi:hypothetical protein